MIKIWLYVLWFKPKPPGPLASKCNEWNCDYILTRLKMYWCKMIRNTIITLWVVVTLGGPDHTMWPHLRQNRQWPPMQMLLWQKLFGIMSKHIIYLQNLRELMRFCTISEKLSRFFGCFQLFWLFKVILSSHNDIGSS